ncbi:hypothetical protein CEXT_324901 [Caerostris extrusa]|uniref:Uncharacterized protein n=1 Tax=Caerostris extrusa TaxID=172846 RepID=A0AAV4MG55_CAEEX|nr:hypothetical protein CEXT_324901 [Caerostris extrusa]
MNDPHQMTRQERRVINWPGQDDRPDILRKYNPPGRRLTATPPVSTPRHPDESLFINASLPKDGGKEGATNDYRLQKKSTPIFWMRLLFAERSHHSTRL